MCRAVQYSTLDRQALSRLDERCRGAAVPRQDTHGESSALTLIGTYVFIMHIHSLSLIRSKISLAGVCIDYIFAAFKSESQKVFPEWILRDCLRRFECTYIARKLQYSRCQSETCQDMTRCMLHMPTVCKTMISLQFPVTRNLKRRVIGGGGFFSAASKPSRLKQKRDRKLQDVRVFSTVSRVEANR